MDLDSMLEKCRREQWKLDDLDWSAAPRDMPKDDEIAIVQYFTDMAGIEKLAGALFAVQARKARDPRLREIFESFVVDEERHGAVALRLARHYDVHHYREYRESEALTRFRPHFVSAVEFLSADIANSYITGGELILDVALLRSIDDHVADAMSHSAMQLVNRDESRHIAVDFHMVEYYCSAEYRRQKALEPPPSLGHRVRAAWAFGNVLWRAAPFFKAVFFEPMQVVDPSGKRLREAFKRLQLLGQKQTVQEHPFTRFMQVLQDTYNDHPLARAVFGRLIVRLVGVEPALIARLYDEAEKRRAQRMSFDELAQEALGAKYAA